MRLLRRVPGQGDIAGMIIYLASPQTQQQAEHCSGMPVLLSYALWRDWLDKGYQQSFARVLIDSGAFSEFSSGVKVDVTAYAEWAERWRYTGDAVAGLDDISGDWRRSLANYEKMPDGLGFPTFHESDPDGLLDDLIPIARARGNWLGLGLLPPRQGKERWVRAALDRVPEDIHVHGFALREYTHLRRLDSADSTNWWRDAMNLRAMTQLGHLSYGECLEIIIKRYQRWRRAVCDRAADEPTLFDYKGDS